MSTVQQIGVLSNVQIELLKAFSHNLEDSELKELRKRIAIFFAERLIAQADKTWEDKNLNNAAMDKILNSDIKSELK